jgi:hypothetical protein
MISQLTVAYLRAIQSCPKIATLACHAAPPHPAQRSAANELGDLLEESASMSSGISGRAESPVLRLNHP